jgi:beta-glucanase (GH16 family)
MAKKENFTLNGVTLGYTSARLNSKYAFRYGRVDVRAKLPEGDGTWPAIWTLGKNISEQGAYWQTQGFGTTGWPACGEIDVMEHGLHATNVVSSAIHTPSSSGATVNTSTYPLADVVNNYHVYSVNWSPNQITFLVDGVGYYTYNPATKNASTWPFDLEQFLLLNVAMGGIGGTIDPNFTQSPMVIDYVRVYQNADILSTKRFTGNTEVRMYPNPTTNFVNISSDVAIEAIEMYNVLGKKVHQAKTNSNTLNLDVSTFAKGLYILKFKVNNGTIIKKLIVK